MVQYRPVIETEYSINSMGRGMAIRTRWKKTSFGGWVLVFGLPYIKNILFGIGGCNNIVLGYFYCVSI
jgi:hypothetical protein